MELTEDETADRAHLCPGRWEGSKRRLGLFLLVFFLWLQLPLPMRYPTLTLTEQQEEPWGGECVIQVCLHVCAYVNRSATIRLESQPSWQFCKVQSLGEGSVFFTGIRHMDSHLSPSLSLPGFLLIQWRLCSYMGRSGLQSQQLQGCAYASSCPVSSGTVRHYQDFRWQLGFKIGISSLMYIFKMTK